MPKRKQTDDIRLYCCCKTPNDPSKSMIECELCQEWFHTMCFNLPDDVEDIDWVCSACLEILEINPAISNQGLLRLQGRVTPKSGWTNKVVLTELDESVYSKISNLSGRIQREAYRLWHSGRVQQCFSNESLKPTYIFFQSHVKASMKQKTYRVDISLKQNPTSINWTCCGCPAGINGECKHVLSTFYDIRHRILLEEPFFPDVVVPTQTMQRWHARKPVNDEPLLFSKVVVKKIDSKERKRGLGEKVTEYENLVDITKYVTSTALENLATSLQQLNLTILDTWKSAEYLPILPKEINLIDLSKDLFENMNRASRQFLDYKSLFKTEIDNNSDFFKNAIEMTMEESKLVEQKTRMQSKSPHWKSCRILRITASNFYRYSRSRNPISLHKQLQREPHSEALKHGKIYEDVAIKQFMDTNTVFTENLAQSNIGLVINPSVPYFGASPDYIVCHDNELCILEVKCPYALYVSKIKIREKAKERNWYLHYENSQLEVNPLHSCYLQIQAQLTICNVDKAYLIIFVPPNDIEYVLVKRSDISNEMLILSDVWFKSLLPFFAEHYINF